MSSTDKTPNYNLPIFIGTDKPAWLSDWNGAMNAIDTGIANASQTGSSAEGKANNAQTTADTAKTTADKALDNSNNAQNTADEALLKANSNGSKIVVVDTNLTFKQQPLTNTSNSDPSTGMTFISSPVMGRLISGIMTVPISQMVGTTISGGGGSTYYDLATVKGNYFNMDIIQPSDGNKYLIGYPFAVFEGGPTTLYSYTELVSYFDGTFTHVGLQANLSSIAQNLRIRLAGSFSYFNSGSIITEKMKGVMLTSLSLPHAPVPSEQ